MSEILRVFFDTMRYPLQDAKWIPKVVIGGLLNLIPIADLVAWGYLYKVFIDSLSQSAKEELPTWDDWRQYLAAGVYMLGIGIVYALLSLALFLLLFLIIPPLAPLLALVSLDLVLPMAIARFTVERRFAAAFHFSRIYQKIQLVAREYISTALLFTVIIGLSGIILLNGVLGLLIWPFWSFYLLIVFARMMGEIISPTLIDEIS